LRPPRTPLLYLHGVLDGCMQVAFTDGLTELLPTGSEVARIDHAGHFVHLDQRDRVHRRIVGFLGS
ncbi:alpha/beta hydrolase, partial [Streptomyces sp. SID10244]|nr:alpha/beta hydrolase [Streptomyces sp. SID10244]